MATRKEQMRTERKLMKKAIREGKVVPKLKNWYVIRSIAIKELGFESYKEYLDSELWAAIRQVVMIRDKRLCVLCGQRATECHHQAYTHDALRGNDLKRIHAVCRSCHYQVEFSSEGKRRESIDEVRREFNRLRELHKSH